MAFPFFLFESRPDIFLLRALPAADCDTKLLLSSSVLSSELSRRSLAYPGPTEINLAWSVRAPAHSLAALGSWSFVPGGFASNTQTEPVWSRSF